MRRRPSSALSFINKLVQPLLWGAALNIYILYKFANPATDPEGYRWLLLLALCPASFVLYWYGVRLKKVEVDERFLYISNYWKEVAIPLTEVAQVFGGYFSGLVTVQLHSSCEFSAKIVFMPKQKTGKFSYARNSAQELTKHIEGATKNIQTGQVPHIRW